MKYETATILIAFFGLAASAPVPEPKNVFKLPVRTLRAREVPQEHSHNDFIATVRTSLATNNPNNIEDPVFGLLGSAAAAAGQGTISDVNCLQQATADQAFTNAKAAGDVTGMTAALVYRALERNTGSVGLASVPCTSITAVNPEIAAVQQHQDPASSGAAAINKNIVLTLAQQIASIGGDPQTALQSGTFAPGTIGDPTGAGNTCDVADDTTGCIFTQNLLVEDATAAEISAAVLSAPATVATPAPVAVSSAVAVAATPAASECSVPAATSVAAVSVAAASPTTVASSSSALDFGSCGSPAIVFGAGFDGRTEESFEPVDLQSFNHGSADNIGIISSFICGQLSTACAADAAAVSACTSAETAASSLTGQAAADAFNSALGVSASSTSTTATTSVVASTSAATSAAAVIASVPATSAPAAAVGANVQTFTGALGGLPPPVINTGGDRPFSTDDATFVNAAAAIQRSCSVQHNLCADAANSGTLAGGEAQCETQETACNALIS